MKRGRKLTADSYIFVVPEGLQIYVPGTKRFFIPFKKRNHEIANDRDSDIWQEARFARDEMLRKQGREPLVKDAPIMFFALMSVFKIDFAIHQKMSRGCIVKSIEFRFTRKSSNIIGLAQWFRANWGTKEGREQMFPDIQDRFVRELIFGKFAIELMSLLTKRGTSESSFTSVMVQQMAEGMKLVWLKKEFSITYEKFVNPYRL